MANDVAGELSAALYRIFRAIARLALRRGVPFDAVADVAKRAFVDVARDDFTIPGRKQSASRVSLLTGIHRKEVARFLDAQAFGDEQASNRVTGAAGVIAGWRRDRAFSGPRGQPAALRFDSGARSFSALVRRYGKGDVPARAVLDELIRVGAAKRLRDGRIRLSATAYVPEVTSLESLAILGTDVADLVSTIDHNLSREPGAGFFQRKVSYDNLPSEALDDIRSRVEREGQALLEKLDASMSKHDRDSNPKVGGTGRNRAMVGVYYFEEPAKDDSSEEKP